jgi:hypothetical protein
MENNWHKFGRKRERRSSGQLSLADLIVMMALILKTGRISEAEWRKYVSQTVGKLSITNRSYFGSWLWRWCFFISAA